MNTKHFKDSSDNIFGLDTNSPNWEAFIQKDWIEITIEEAQAIANPPPTQQELNAQKEAENIAFLSSETRRVNDAIAPLDDAVEFDIATEDEITQHKELRKYRILLSRVPNQKAWPLNPVFPTCPDFFSE